MHLNYYTTSVYLYIYVPTYKLKKNPYALKSPSKKNKNAKISNEQQYANKIDSITVEMYYVLN